MITQANDIINFTQALFHVTARALALYPAEATRIQRGAAIAQHGAVHFRADGSADVESQSEPGRMYHTNGLCTCPDHLKAPAGRCKHKWSRSLTIWAAKYQEESSRAIRYQAHYHAPDGETIYGTAEYDPTPEGDDRWLFIDESGGEKPLFTCRAALVLGPRCDLFDAQAAEDATLGARYASPQYPAMYDTAEAAIAAAKAAIAARQAKRSSQAWGL